MQPNKRTPKPQSSKVLEETLKSLQDLIKEVDETPGPGPAPSSPDPGRPGSAPPARTNTPGGGEASTTPADTPTGPGDTHRSDQPRDSLAAPGTKPGPFPETAAGETGELFDDVPLLQDIALLPGDHRPGIHIDDRSRGNMAVPATTAYFEPAVIAEVVDQTIERLDDDLRRRTGQRLDLDIRQKLRQQLYAALQMWAADTEHRLRDQDNK